LNSPLTLTASGNPPTLIQKGNAFTTGSTVNQHLNSLPVTGNYVVFFVVTAGGSTPVGSSSMTLQASYTYGGTEIMIFGGIVVSSDNNPYVTTSKACITYYEYSNVTAVNASGGAGTYSSGNYTFAGTPISLNSAVLYVTAQSIDNPALSAILPGGSVVDFNFVNGVSCNMQSFRCANVPVGTPTLGFTTSASSVYGVCQITLQGVASGGITIG
jgi:hypothetical protein